MKVQTQNFDQNGKTFSIAGGNLGQYTYLLLQRCEQKITRVVLLVLRDEVLVQEEEIATIPHLFHEPIEGSFFESQNKPFFSMTFTKLTTVQTKTSTVTGDGVLIQWDQETATVWCFDGVLANGIFLTSVMNQTWLVVNYFSRLFIENKRIREESEKIAEKPSQDSQESRGTVILSFPGLEPFSELESSSSFVCTGLFCQESKENRLFLWGQFKSDLSIQNKTLSTISPVSSWFLILDDQGIVQQFKVIPEEMIVLDGVVINDSFYFTGRRSDQFFLIRIHPGAEKDEILSRQITGVHCRLSLKKTSDQNLLLGACFQSVLSFEDSNGKVVIPGSHLIDFQLLRFDLDLNRNPDSDCTVFCVCSKTCSFDENFIFITKQSFDLSFAHLVHLEKISSFPQENQNLLV